MIIMPSGVFLKVYKGLLPVHQAKNPLYKMPPGPAYDHLAGLN